MCYVDHLKPLFLSSCAAAAGWLAAGLLVAVAMGNYVWWFVLWAGPFSLTISCIFHYIYIYSHAHIALDHFQRQFYPLLSVYFNVKTPLKLVKNLRTLLFLRLDCSKSEWRNLALACATLATISRQLFCAGHLFDRRRILGQFRCDGGWVEGVSGIFVVFLDSLLRFLPEFVRKWLVTARVAE